MLDELERRSLTASLNFQKAQPATDAELCLFHAPDFVAGVRARCATNRGSLDRAPAQVNANARRLLTAVAAEERATAQTLATVLTDLHSTFEAFAPFLVSEGLVTWDDDQVQLTEGGRDFLADPGATLGGPTYARAHAEQAARWICGAVLHATRGLVDTPDTVFIPIAGFHHAHRDEARMYCLYNDPALAIAAALETLEGPVAYIDIDIHHGDGVYRAFADDPRVIIADLHERPVTGPTEYSGEGPAAGSKLTLGIAPGTDDDAYFAVWEQVEAFVDAAEPAFVIFEAGVDGLADDPLSDQALTPEVFGRIARRVKALADEHAGGRLLVLGGGGYEPTGTARAWATIVQALVSTSTGRG